MCDSNFVNNIFYPIFCLIIQLKNYIAHPLASCQKKNVPTLQVGPFLTPKGRVKKTCHKKQCNTRLLVGNVVVTTHHHIFLSFQIWKKMASLKI